MIKFSGHTGEKQQILAIGIGGAGSSVIDKINNCNIEGIDTFFIDTDSDNVNISTAKEKFYILNKLFKELGTELSGQELKKGLRPFINLLPNTQIVFIISGLGGSTGSIVTPHLIQLLREKSYWVWCLVTIPFFFEGKQKILNSLKMLKLVQQSANAILVIPHDKIFKMVDKNLSMKEAFTPANNLCAELVLSVNRLCGIGNWANIGISDIKGRIINKRSTSFGFGEGTGERRIQMAMEQAISCPLMGKEVINSLEGLIVSISGSETLALDEVNAGIEYLRKIISKDTDIISGVSIEPDLKDKVKVGLIAIGIDLDSNIRDWDLSSVTTVSAKDTGYAKRVPILNRPLQQFQRPKQTMIDFKKLSKGRFEKSEATIYGGEDLDIPTFLRRKK